MEELTAECSSGVTDPLEYIVLGGTGGEVDGERVTAVSIMKWNEGLDQRVWMALGSTEFRLSLRLLTSR